MWYSVKDYQYSYWYTALYHVIAYVCVCPAVPTFSVSRGKVTLRAANMWSACCHLISQRHWTPLHISFNIVCYSCVGVIHMWVCVCVWERKRGRDREKSSTSTALWASPRTHKCHLLYTHTYPPMYRRKCQISDQKRIILLHRFDCVITWHCLISCLINFMHELWEPLFFFIALQAFFI